MKRHAYLAKRRALRSRERREFEILELFINLGEFDPGPFGVYAKTLHYSVSDNDSDEPPAQAAQMRANHLSNKFWPKERHECDTKPAMMGAAATEMTPDSQTDVVRAFVRPTHTDTPPPGCAVIWMMCPPDWYKKSRRRRM